MFFRQHSLKQKLSLVVAGKRKILEKKKKLRKRGGRREKKKKRRKAEKTTSVAEIMHCPGIAFPHIPVIRDDNRCIKITEGEKQTNKQKENIINTNHRRVTQSRFLFL